MEERVRPGIAGQIGVTYYVAARANALMNTTSLARIGNSAFEAITGKPYTYIAWEVAPLYRRKPNPAGQSAESAETGRCMAKKDIDDESDMK